MLAFCFSHLHPHVSLSLNAFHQIGPLNFFISMLSAACGASALFVVLSTCTLLRTLSCFVSRSVPRLVPLVLMLTEPAFNKFLSLFCHIFPLSAVFRNEQSTPFRKDLARPCGIFASELGLYLTSIVPDVDCVTLRSSS